LASTGSKLHAPTNRYKLGLIDNVHYTQSYALGNSSKHQCMLMWGFLDGAFQV